jgi:hypothetical protein
LYKSSGDLVAHTIDLNIFAKGQEYLCGCVCCG